MKKICKIFLWALGLFTVLCAILLFVCNQIVVSNAKGKVFPDIDSVRYNQVGLLLGTTPQSRLTKATNYFFVYRIDAAEQLYKAGKIKKILISGSDDSLDGVNEPECMRDSLMARGIPERDIVLDGKGYRTISSIINANKKFGLKSFTIISQAFHNERAIYQAEHLGLNVENIQAYNAKMPTSRWAYITSIREYFARVKMFWDLLTMDDVKSDRECPYLSVSRVGDDLLVSDGIHEDRDWRIPTKYIEHKYERTKEEKEAEEKERIRRRNERLNSPRCAHFFFDGTYNGYKVDVVIHPEEDENEDRNGMARYHFKNRTHDFYIETAFTWRWYWYVGDIEKVPFKGESYHAKLPPKEVVLGEGDEFAEDYIPFFFKDVDFDGEYEILFRAGGYHGTYYDVYKVVSSKSAVLMSDAPFNNFVIAWRWSPEDDSIGIHFDYQMKTITVNEPLGVDYQHDVWKRNPNSKNRLHPMKHIAGIYTTRGVCYKERIFKKYDEITTVEQSFSIDSIWSVYARYDKTGKDVKLVKLELLNARNKRLRHNIKF